MDSVKKGIVACYLPGQVRDYPVDGRGPSLVDAGTGSAITQTVGRYGRQWTGTADNNNGWRAALTCPVSDTVGVTMMIVSRPASTNGRTAFALTNASTGQNGAAFNIYKSTNIRSGVRREDATTYRIINASPAHNNEWFTYISASHADNLRRDVWNMNGVLGENVNTGTTSSSSSALTQVVLGAWYDAEVHNSSWDGDIALAVVWNRPLSQAEQWALARNPWQIFKDKEIRSYVNIPDEYAELRLEKERRSQPPAGTKLDV